ncbi:hypothetical protein N7492_009249 [Penicillium capsulatum]|uniref:Uncharacterized protein n=1 Tax=Penicillium capsulatum TaxID=69766 RepID=A0A9W9LGP2_9EURO|nr:hypothetical protein N7492_009249 [Penicillium capsulatum]
MAGAHPSVSTNPIRHCIGTQGVFGWPVEGLMNAEPLVMYPSRLSVECRGTTSLGSNRGFVYLARRPKGPKPGS